MQHHVFAISESCAVMGIKHVIICPGSRSAPLVYAFTSNNSFACYSIIDERSAGYIALGIAQQTQQPVAIICTSGTAALNLYPAIAEAFFQQIPLVILTADRPAELLHQQDGQMINQNFVFDKNIAHSAVIPSYQTAEENFDETAKIVTDSIHIASSTKAPVHINIPLREPLYPLSHKHLKDAQLKAQQRFKQIDSAQPQQTSYNQTEIDFINSAWNAAKKKLVLIGQNPVDNELFTALYELSKQDDVVIIGDILSNKQSILTIQNVDMVISQSDPKTLSLLNPEVIISLGGPLVSKSIKNWLKNNKPIHHFRINTSSIKVDTYNHVTKHFYDQPANFLRLITNKISSNESVAYKQLWQLLGLSAQSELTSFLQKSPLVEISAMSHVFAALPDAINLHLSNSSVVRYASVLGNLKPSWTLNGNRGTSGIDGCTSTAVGAAVVNNKLTVLITGDIGFLYDKNALWNNIVPDNLRIIVINNNGGGIFTLIDGPSTIPNQLNYFTTPIHGSIRNTALDNNLEYYFCDNTNELQLQLKTFFHPKNKAAILEVKCNMIENAAIYKQLKKITIS